MARTDYYGIQTPVLQATSQAIRTVNGTVGTIAPEDYPDLISAMHSQSDYENALDQMVEETASGDIVSFADGANDIPVKSLIANVDPVQSGTGDPSPDNVRPITGRTSATVTHTGKNLFDKNTSNLIANSYLSANGTVNLSNNYFISDYIKVSGDKVTISGGTVSGNSISVCWYDGAKNFVSGEQHLNHSFPHTYTIPTDAVYMRESIANVDLDNVQIELGSTATDFEPYYGEVYNIPFVDDQGEPITVYGGKLNLTTGALEVDWVSADLSQLSFTKTTSGLFATTSLRNSIKFADSGYTASRYIKSSHFNVIDSTSITGPQGATPSLNGVMAENVTGTLYFNYTDVTTIEEFKTAMNGVQLVYELATPQEIQLTPQQINSFLGGNTFYADTGDVEVTYRANGQLYIEQH